MHSPSRKRGKPRDSHHHLLSVLYTQKIYVMNKEKKYACTRATVPATSSEYWPDLLCKLFLKPSKNRGISSTLMTEIKFRMPYGYLKQLLDFSTYCFTGLKNSYCPG